MIRSDDHGPLQWPQPCGTACLHPTCYVLIRGGSSSEQGALTWKCKECQESVKSRLVEDLGKEEGSTAYHMIMEQHMLKISLGSRREQASDVPATARRMIVASGSLCFPICAKRMIIAPGLDNCYNNWKHLKTCHGYL